MVFGFDADKRDVALKAVTDEMRGQHKLRIYTVGRPSGRTAAALRRPADAARRHPPGQDATAGRGRNLRLGVNSKGGQREYVFSAPPERQQDPFVMSSPLPSPALSATRRISMRKLMGVRWEGEEGATLDYVFKPDTFEGLKTVCRDTCGVDEIRWPAR
ncbi:hypothetical protein [Methylobacterium tarhaniae]|uniref:hypothetical protein n=1 Tax=Methylobacterium tarhaniae TaxID=1187852 RepID=UPI003D07DB5D